MNEEFLQALDAHSHIGVISHFRLDGDAIGSTLAMGPALRAQGKRVRLFLMKTA